MPDEIDLLRAFRADTPGPDDAAWERARAAIDARRGARRWRDGTGSCSRLTPAVGPAGYGESAGTGSPGDRSPSRPRGRRRRVAAGIVTTVLQPPPSLNAPLVSAWQPARPLPSGSTGITTRAGTWHLMGYLVAEGWQENTTGPEPGPITCPTATTCYVEGNSARSPSGPADMNSFYVSSDGAHTWSVLPVPAGVTFTSALSCASETDCAAGGLYYGHQPVYLSTANGGHSWTVRPLRAAVGRIMTLACATTTACRGLSSATGQPASPGIATMYLGLRFVVTTDGGRHFTVVKFPKNVAMQSVSLPDGLALRGDRRAQQVQSQGRLRSRPRRAANF